MASKARGGLSKREYAAKQAGGSLSYKTGKISVPVKKTATVKSSSKSSSANIGPWAGGLGSQAEYGPGGSKLTNIGPWAAGYGSEQEYGPGSAADQRQKASSSYNKSKSSSSNKSKSPSSVSPTSSLDADAFNSSFGINTANAQDYNSVKQTPTKVRSGLASQLLDYGTGTAKTILSVANPAIGAAFNFLEKSGIDISQSLGIDKYLQKDSVLSNWTDDQGNVLGVSTQRDLNDIASQNEGTLPSNVNDIMAEKQKARDDYNTFRTQGFAAVGNGSPSGASPTKSSPSGESPKRTSPSPLKPSIPGISQPNITQRTEGLSFDSAPDNTQIVNNQSTIPQFLGSGRLSTGQYANGKGGYGFEGSMTGTGGTMSAEQNILNQLLGIDTASAMTTQEQPMSNLNMFYKNQFAHPMSSMNNITPSATYNGIKNGSNPIVDTSGSTGGYTAPRQYAAPAQTDPAVAQYQDSIKGYDKQAKATEKAYKRALAAMLKGIEEQYATSQKEGTTALDTQKQQDLLKQSGLFQFANQDPNSEQRIQYDQRMNNDYATQLTNLISKLAAAKNQDILSAKSGNEQQASSAMNQIMSAKQSAQQNLANLISSIQRDNLNRAAKAGETKSTKNMSLEAVRFDKFGNPSMWVDQSTGDIYDNSDFQG